MENRGPEISNINGFLSKVSLGHSCTHSLLSLFLDLAWELPQFRATYFTLLTSLLKVRVWHHTDCQRLDDITDAIASRDTSKGHRAHQPAEGTFRSVNTSSCLLLPPVLKSHYVFTAVQHATLHSQL